LLTRERLVYLDGLVSPSAKWACKPTWARMRRVPAAAAKSLNVVAEPSDSLDCGKPKGDNKIRRTWVFMQTALFRLFCSLFRFADQRGQTVHLAFGIVGAGFCEVFWRAEIGVEFFNGLFRVFR